MKAKIKDTGEIIEVYLSYYDVFSTLYYDIDGQQQYEEEELEFIPDKVVTRTERGWAGHFICSDQCLFRRNTLLTCRDTNIVVSTVGFMVVRGKLEMIGDGTYYETKAFFSDEKDLKYHDIDVEKEIIFNRDPYIWEKDSDIEANNMHEEIVKELTDKLLNNEKIEIYE